MIFSPTMNSRSILSRPAVSLSIAMSLVLGCGPKQNALSDSKSFKNPVIEELSYTTIQRNGLETSWPISITSVIEPQDHYPLYKLEGRLIQNTFELKSSTIQNDVQQKVLALSESTSSSCNQKHCASSLLGKNLPVELIYWSALLSLFEESSLMSEAQAEANGRGKYQHKNESLTKGIQEENEQLAEIAQRVRLHFYAAPNVKCAATLLLFSEDDQSYESSIDAELIKRKIRPPEHLLQEGLGLNTGGHNVVFQQERGPTGQYEITLMISESDESSTGQSELNDIHLFCSSPNPIFAMDQNAYSVSGDLEEDTGWRVWVGSN